MSGPVLHPPRRNVDRTVQAIRELAWRPGASPMAIAEHLAGLGLIAPEVDEPSLPVADTSNQAAEIIERLRGGGTTRTRLTSDGGRITSVVYPHSSAAIAEALARAGLLVERVS